MWEGYEEGWRSAEAVGHKRCEVGNGLKSNEGFQIIFLVLYPPASKGSLEFQNISHVRCLRPAAMRFLDRSKHLVSPTSEGGGHSRGLKLPPCTHLYQLPPW